MQNNYPSIKTKQFLKRKGLEERQKRHITLKGICPPTTPRKKKGKNAEGDRQQWEEKMIFKQKCEMTSN